MIDAYTNLVKPMVEKSIQSIKQYADDNCLRIINVDDCSIELEVEAAGKSKIRDEIFRTIIYPNAKSMLGNFYELYEINTNTLLGHLALSDKWAIDDFMIH